MNPQFATAPSRRSIASRPDPSSRGNVQQPLLLPAPAHPPHRPRALQLRRQHSDDSGSHLSSRRRHEQRQLQSQRGPMMHVRSKSIPIHPAASGEMKRTPSEQQLHEDEALADYRDLAMFRRIAEGIQRRQRDTTHRHPRMVNDLCLASIIDTRSLTEDELASRTRPPDPAEDAAGEGGGSPRKRNSHHEHSSRHRHVHRDEKITSYLDPSTCKWIIASNHHHDPHPPHQHYRGRLSPASAMAAAGFALSETLSSHSVSAEDEMLFPLEL